MGIPESMNHFGYNQPNATTRRGDGDGLGPTTLQLGSRPTTTTSETRQQPSRPENRSRQIRPGAYRLGGGGQSEEDLPDSRAFSCRGDLGEEDEQNNTLLQDHFQQDVPISLQAHLVDEEAEKEREKELDKLRLRN